MPGLATLGAIGLTVALFLAFFLGLTRSRHWPLVTGLLAILVLAMLLDRCAWS